MLKYALISLEAVTVANWQGKKHFTHYRYDADFLYPTSYVYDSTSNKMGKSDFRLWTEGVSCAKISNCIFITCKHVSMELEKHFIHYRYDANFLYLMSYVMTPLILKLKPKEKSDFRFSTEGLGNAKISNYIFISSKLVSMRLEKPFLTVPISHKLPLSNVLCIWPH